MFRLTNDPDVVILADNDIHRTIPRGHRYWQDYEEWLAAGNVPAPAATFDELKAQKVADIQKEFLDSLAHGVEVSSEAITLTMDAGEEHAVRLKHGIELAELNGLTEMTITDYHNVDHPGISIADASAIAIAMGNDFATKRARKNALRTQALAATSEADLAGIVW